MRRSIRTEVWIASAVAIAFVLAPPVRFKRVSNNSNQGHSIQFDATRAARDFWNASLMAAVHQGLDAKSLLADLEIDRASAEHRLGRQPAINGHFFFIVKGEGIVTEIDSRGIWLHIDDANSIRVHLVRAPVVGTALRDSSGLLDVSKFNSRDFNALSAALNLLSEGVSNNGDVKGAAKGERIGFEGCAELRTEDDPLVLDIVPVVLSGPK